MVVFRQSGFFQAKVVLFGQNGCIRARCCIQAKYLYSGKVIVFRKSFCIPEKVVGFGKKMLYSG